MGDILIPPVEPLCLQNKKMATTKRTIKQTHLGTHIIAELFGCQNLNNLSFVRAALIESARVCGATILHTKFHKFSPQGLTGYILLAESHISIHTWPEYNYAAVDVFTCGPMNPEKAVSYLVGQFKAQKADIHKMERGAKKLISATANKTIKNFSHKNFPQSSVG